MGINILELSRQQAFFASSPEVSFWEIWPD